MNINFICFQLKQKNYQVTYFSPNKMLFTQVSSWGEGKGVRLTRELWHGYESDINIKTSGILLSCQFVVISWQKVSRLGVCLETMGQNCWKVNGISASEVSLSYTFFEIVIQSAKKQLKKNPKTYIYRDDR